MTDMEKARELAERLSGVAYQANMRNPKGYEEMICNMTSIITSALKQEREEAADRAEKALYDGPSGKDYFQAVREAIIGKED